MILRKHYILLISYFTLIFGFTSFGLQAQSEEFREFNTEIQEAITQENWIYVLDLAKAQINEDNERGEGYYYTAYALHRLGKDRMAKPYLDHLRKLRQENLREKVTQLEASIFGEQSKRTKATQLSWDEKSMNKLRDRFYYGVVYSPTTPLGLSFGNLNHFGVGTFLTIRANQMIFTSPAPFSVNSEGMVTGSIPQGQAEASGRVQTGQGEFLMGLTWKLVRPIWMYAGAGLHHSREFWEMEMSDQSDNFLGTVWARNPSATFNKPIVESGFIWDLNGVNLRLGLSLVDFDFSQPRFQTGLGFSLGKK